MHDALETAKNGCLDLRRSLAKPAECHKTGPHAEALIKIRKVIGLSISNAYANGARGILRGYLYDLQPRSPQALAVLP